MDTYLTRISVGRINIAGFCTFLAGIFCLAIWIPTKSYGVLIFFALIVGTCSGTFWTTIGPVSAEIVGLKELPSALSITWLVLVLPTTCKSGCATPTISVLRFPSFGAHSTPTTGEHWEHLSACSDLRRFDVHSRSALYVGVASLEDRTIRASRSRTGEICGQYRRCGCRAIDRFVFQLHKPYESEV